MTLTVNNQLHQYEGFASMVKSYNSNSKYGAKFDMSQLFLDLKSAYRTLYVNRNDKVTCIDDVVSGDGDCNICWNMVTSANAKIVDDRTISLTQKGKEVILRTTSPNAKVFIRENHSGKSYDADNGNTLRVGFDVAVKAQSKCKIKVELVPQK